ncbi:MAG: hypothetical protein RLZZ306_1624 [Bacteroidota bacterium]
MPFRSFSQTPLLERPITLSVNNEKISVVLDNISRQGNFSFSYNSAIFDVNNRGDITVVNKPVREVLNLIFKGIITYKVRGNYIILQKNIQKESPKTIILSGYIIDTQTDKPLSKATVYDPKSLSSTISNQYGFYRIKLTVSNLPIKLMITKADYEKRIFVLKSALNTYEDIELTPIIVKSFDIPVYEDNSIEKKDNHVNQDLSLENKPVTQPIAPPFPDITDQNLFPTTPIVDSTLYENRWDEFKKKVGIILVSRSQRINAQNVDDSLSRNFQVSLLPFLGTNRSLSGSIKNDYSLNLLMGYSGGVRKLEVGGILNGVRNDVQGLQVAGVGNIVGGNVVGGQISSTFNIAGNVESGIQLSSGFNVIIKESSGWQISSINFAHKVVKGGKQIGFINISDSTETTPIGFLSFVGSGNGYKRLELLVDENQTAIFSFKTGVKQFYNVLALHYNFTRKKEIFGIGYGIGRAFEVGNSWMMNTDLTTNLLVEYDDLSPNVAALWKLDVSFEKQIARNVAVTVGPSIKYLDINEYNSTSWVSKPFNKIPSYKTISSTINSTFWIGFQMGLRIRSRRS